MTLQAALCLQGSELLAGCSALAPHRAALRSQPSPAQPSPCQAHAHSTAVQQYSSCSAICFAELFTLPGLWNLRALLQAAVTARPGWAPRCDWLQHRTLTGQGRTSGTVVVFSVVLDGMASKPTNALQHRIWAWGLGLGPRSYLRDRFPMAFHLPMGFHLPMVTSHSTNGL